MQPHMKAPLSFAELIPAQTSAFLQRIQLKLSLCSPLHFECHFAVKRHHSVIKNDTRTILILLQIIHAQWYKFGRRHYFSSRFAVWVNSSTSMYIYGYVAATTSFSHSGWIMILNAGNHRPVAGRWGKSGESTGSNLDCGSSLYQRFCQSRWILRNLSYSSSRLFPESLPRKQLYWILINPKSLHASAIWVR